MIPLWQKLLSLFVYMLPWSDAIPFGRSLFVHYPFFKWLALPTLPLIIIRQGIPFGGLLLFLGLFLGVVRNSKVPYYFRFNTLQALLIDIGVVVISYGFQIILEPLSSALLIRTISSTIFIAILTIVIFAISECLQGNEPNLPGISEAVKMQL